MLRFASRYRVETAHRDFGSSSEPGIWDWWFVNRGGCSPAEGHGLWWRLGPSTAVLRRFPFLRQGRHGHSSNPPPAVLMNEKCGDAGRRGVRRFLRVEVSVRCAYPFLSET